MSTKLKHSKKWLILLIFIILIICIVIIACNLRVGSKEKVSNEIPIENNNYENENKEEKANDIVEDKEIMEDNYQNDEVQNNNTSNNNISTNQEEDKQVSSNNSSNIKPNNDTITEPPKELTEWEKLGISEYDYYNSPAWKWQTVDFGINLDGSKKCSNENECLTKCQEYGNEYLLDHNGGFKCNNVISYSGKYLGEDFEFFELQP